MIVEYATVTRKDGTESRFGREKGRKLFALLTPAGVPDPMGIGYSRRSLNERPQKDRNVANGGLRQGEVIMWPLTRLYYLRWLGRLLGTKEP